MAKVAVIFILSLFFLIVFPFAGACSIEFPPNFEILCTLDQAKLSQEKICLNSDCSVYAEKEDSFFRVTNISERAEPRMIRAQISQFVSGNLSRLSAYTDGNRDRNYFFVIAQELCTKDLIKVKEYIDTISMTPILIQPYSETEVIGMDNANNNLRSCTLNEHKVVDGWLLSLKKYSPYCRSAVIGLGMCSHSYISETGLAWYSLTHPGESIKFFLVYLLIAIAAFAFSFYLFSRRELGVFIKPTFRRLAPFVFFSFSLFWLALFWGTGEVENVILSLILLWLLICFIAYIFNRLTKR